MRAGLGRTPPTSEVRGGGGVCDRHYALTERCTRTSSVQHNVAARTPWDPQNTTIITAPHPSPLPLSHRTSPPSPLPTPAAPATPARRPTPPGVPPVLKTCSVLRSPRSPPSTCSTPRSPRTPRPPPLLRPTDPPRCRPVRVAPSPVTPLPSRQGSRVVLQMWISHLLIDPRTLLLET